MDLENLYFNYIHVGNPALQSGPFCSSSQSETLSADLVVLENLIADHSGKEISESI